MLAALGRPGPACGPRLDGCPPAPRAPYPSTFSPVPAPSAPIVLGSAPSSGSTLLRVVLGRLPSVVTGGELNVMDRPEIFDVDAAELRREMSTWLRHGRPR